MAKVRVLFALLGLLAFVAGCGDGGVSKFTGGTKSKDKQPIPSAMNAAAANSAPSATSQESGSAGLEGPAVASKAASDAGDDVDDEGPIRETSMKYRAGRMRDPFMSLIGGDDIYGGIVDLSVVTLVGVVLGESAFCVVEDSEGTSYVLHKGDRVKNGRVIEIRGAAMVCSQTILGYTTTVKLKLENGKDGKHG